MIARDQPTIFGNELFVRLSSVEDGNMRDVNTLTEETVQNYEAFLHLVAPALNRKDVIYQLVRFEGDNYTRYTLVDADTPRTIKTPLFADGSATNQVGHGIFIPLADCTGAVLFDSVHRSFMVSHLGRHSTEQRGAIKSVEFMRATFGSRPENIKVWLSPSPSGTAYPLWRRDGRSFTDVNTTDMRDAGILAENIEVSLVDTVTDHNYFSHSQYLKGNCPIDGRYGIFAALM